MPVGSPIPDFTGEATDGTAYLTVTRDYGSQRMLEARTTPLGRAKPCWRRWPGRRRIASAWSRRRSGRA
jgi:hypothetical protein